MKNADFFDDSNSRYGYETIYRHNYADLFKGFSANEGLSMLFDKKTLGAAAFSMFLWGVYGIPIMMAIIWGSYYLGNGITRVVYAMFGTSRKVRWQTNSFLYFVMTTWVWVWFPAILFLVFILVGEIPFGLYHVMMVQPGDYSFDAASLEVNLFMKLVWDTIHTSHGPVEFVLRFAFWDYLHPLASTIKITMAPVLGYLVYWRGHSEITAEDFYAGEEDGRDAWLLYEKREGRYSVR